MRRPTVEEIEKARQYAMTIRLLIVIVALFSLVAAVAIRHGWR